MCLNFDYVIINDDFERAAQDLIGIVTHRTAAAPAPASRHAELIDRLKRLNKRIFNGPNHRTTTA